MFISVMHLLGINRGKCCCEDWNLLSIFELVNFCIEVSAEKSGYLQYWFSASGRLLKAQLFASFSLKSEFWQCYFLHFPSLVNNFREEGRWQQCLYRSGDASNENILEICQICSKHEEDIARREFQSVPAQHWFVLKLCQIHFITCLSILSC